MTEIDVPDWVVKAAEDARVHRLNAVTAYGSAGVDERYHMAMRAALTAALGAWVVPDGWKLVPVEPTEVMCEAAMSSLGWTRSEAAAKTAPITPASPMMEGSMKVWSAMLATAPAASGVDTSTNEAWAARAQEKIAAMEAATGGEDDMCPNCVTPWKCNGPHESTGGASVSERARELLAGAYRVHGHFEYADILLDKPLVGEDYIAAYAIEQALTQQRGDGEAVDRDAWAEALELPEGYTVEEFFPGGWHYAWTRADGERMVSGTTWNHPALAAIAAWQYAPATTPQPSADAVREIYDAAAKGFHTSETNGAERKYLHVIRFQSIEDLHGYEDAWTAAMVKARDAK